MTFKLLIDQTKLVVYLAGIKQTLAVGLLPANVNFVQWDGGSNSGQVTYNDRLAIPETFTDPSPYQTCINAWMTGAAAGSPALTLAQAQAVKGSLIDAIWTSKRQVPVTVTTSLGSYSFAADEATLGSSWLAAVATLITAVNTLETGLASVAAGFNSDQAALISALNSYTSTIATGITANWTYLIGTASIPVPTATTPASSFSEPTVTYTAASAIAALSASVQMLPVGANSYPAFTLADQFVVLAAIYAQRNAKALTRSQKQIALAALTHTADAISFDATTGW